MIKLPRQIFTALVLLLAVNSYSQCVLTLRPGPADGKDAHVFSLSCTAPYAVSSGECETSNNGNDDQMHTAAWTWMGAPANMRSFIEFDLSSVMAMGCQVSQATLVFPHSGYSSNFHCGDVSTLHPCNDNSITINRVTQSW